VPFLARISCLFGLLAVLPVLACVEGEDDPPLVINEDYYGECADEYSRFVCRDDEPFCDSYPPAGGATEFSVCVPTCTVADDCPVPETGNATIACLGEPAGCVLECGDGEQCPDAMECDPSGACRWPL
jgi:hypothetical protein